MPFLWSTIYISIGAGINMASWDKKDDKIFASDIRIQTVYIICSFIFWPVFFAMRTWRFLRKRFTEDVSEDKL